MNKPMNKTMNKKYIYPFMVVAMVASLTACNTKSSTLEGKAPQQTTVATNPSTTPTPTATPTTNATANPNPTETPSMAQLRSKSPTQPFSSKPFTTETPKDGKKTASKSIDVTLYTSDDQCEKHVPQKVAVSAGEGIEEAVGKIIEKRDTADFSLSGYRVAVKDGVATVDLRMASNSKRQFASLSSCEQFGLFGSMKKTLTSNPQWKIKDVRFTEKGEEIPL
jgi:Sporulation and spore germination